jgi:hypothetical protein
VGVTPGLESLLRDAASATPPPTAATTARINGNETAVAAAAVAEPVITVDALRPDDATEAVTLI